MRSRLALLGTLALLASCSPSGATLTVDLETDMVPGIDFSAVTVEVAASDYASPMLAPGAVTSLATPGTYVPGRRVAEIGGIPLGAHLVRVRLHDATSATVVERLVRLQLQSTYSMVVIVTRDCAGISCPMLDGDPTFTSCVSGMCASPTCSVATPQACPAPVCMHASDCVPTSACVHPVCDQGECLMVGVDSDCGMGQRCDPTLGCVDLPGTIPDAGPPPDAAQPTDACPETELACTNGMDDDCDGLRDCADPDCDAATCDDGVLCTTGDRCTSGACSGTALTCDDGVACTMDSCAEGTGCAHLPSNALCTVMAGGTCDPTLDCQYPTCSSASCMPSDVCDVAACVGSSCTHTPVSCASGSSCCGGTCHASACDDSNPCTTDSFNTTTCACVHTNNTATCSDSSACTTADHCSAGHCIGTVRNCDDSNACTTDGCSAASGCTHADRANGASCSGGACCSGSCVALSGRSHCGACGNSCASGRSCVTVPGRSGLYTCACGSNTECRGEGFGGMATCFSGYCDCQCSAAEPTTCGGQCSSGATCHELTGHNYCQYP